jgi:tryptophan synthase alpha subunit
MADKTFTKQELDEMRKQLNNVMLTRIEERKQHIAQSAKGIQTGSQVVSAINMDQNIKNTLDNLRSKATLITKI